MNVRVGEGAVWGEGGIGRGRCLGESGIGKCMLGLARALFGRGRTGRGS